MIPQGCVLSFVCDDKRDTNDMLTRGHVVTNYHAVFWSLVKNTLEHCNQLSDRNRFKYM